MRQWRASLARSKPNSSTTANTQIAMARGATCSLISKAITIVRGSTPQSATSPHNRQRQKLHNPVSTFPGEGHNANSPNGRTNGPCSSTQAPKRKAGDRKSTRLNSSHVENSYAVFCLKKKKE